jgi:hypothetical protein
MHFNAPVATHGHRPSTKKKDVLSSLKRPLATTIPTMKSERTFFQSKETQRKGTDGLGIGTQEKDTKAQLYYRTVLYTLVFL